MLLTHDENDNGKLDTNLVGMPVEGYGFSNNPQVMRKQTFDEASVDVPAAGTLLPVAMLILIVGHGSYAAIAAFILIYGLEIGSAHV